ncbi:MAG: hypothetical protein ACRESJ_25790 [Pseudomonas sp.]|uniref:hypothetical protein n=1 Tax=Pseudomonas sp. TaxID=306 RepID=UPI003D6EA33E
MKITNPPPHTYNLNPQATHSSQITTQITKTSNTSNALSLNNNPEQSEMTFHAAFTPGANEKLLAAFQGFKTRRQISVHTIAPGIIKTKIHQPLNGKANNHSHPLSSLQALMKPGSTYTRLHIIGGGDSSYVIGTKNEARPESPIALAKQTPPGAAIINGGYFVHKDGLISNDGSKLEIGSPIGEASHRTDNAPVPDIWKEEYGHLLIDEQIALTSGPVLSIDGQQVTLPDHERMQYFLGELDNPLNKYAGALTHSSDYNERAAISTAYSAANEKNDTVMHALTSNGDRSAGASMSDWQNLTNISVSSLPGQRETDNRIGSSTINLDGGGSVFLGTTDDSGMTIHALGGASSESTIRPVANVIVSTPKTGKE